MTEAADARGPWGALAERPEKCRLSMAGAEMLTADTRLVEDGEGASTWVVDRVYRTPRGVLVLARHSRTVGEEVEEVRLWAGVDPADLLASLKADRMVDPGMIETLGRAGMEIGVEPDDEEED